MPVVRVSYTGAKPGIPQRLQNLGASVAYELNVEGVKNIFADDVTVIFTKFGPYDVHKHDVIIEVTAHNFPKRVSKHEVIVRKIGSYVATVLKHSSYAVILNLTPLEWASHVPAAQKP